MFPASGRIRTLLSHQPIRRTSARHLRHHPGAHKVVRGTPTSVGCEVAVFTGGGFTPWVKCPTGGRSPEEVAAACPAKYHPVHRAPPPPPDEGISWGEVAWQVGSIFAPELKLGKAMGVLLAARKLKAVNLPAWRNIAIDMEHVLAGHSAEGAFAAGRTTFPEFMNGQSIERAIRDAYRFGERIDSQGDRVLVRGVSNGLTIEMWVNRATNAIETAYPVGP